MLKMYMTKVKELAKNAEEDDDDMTPPSVRMMNAAKQGKSQKLFRKY